jgi:hypothetical protein
MQIVSGVTCKKSRVEFVDDLIYEEKIYRHFHDQLNVKFIIVNASATTPCLNGL